MTRFERLVLAANSAREDSTVVGFFLRRGQSRPIPAGSHDRYLYLCKEARRLPLDR